MNTASGKGGAAGAASGVWLVASRELNTRLRTRAFVIGTGVIIVVLVAFFALQATLLSGKTTTTVGLSGQATSIAQPMRQQASRVGMTIETRTVAEPSKGHELIKSGKIDVLVSGNVADLHVLVESDMDKQLHALLTGISQSQVLRAKLTQLGLQPADVLSPVAATDIEVSVIDKPTPKQTQRTILGMIIVVLMFMAIMIYGNLVTQGVIEEKSSRIVELLLATVRPWQIMLGKVLGLGLVGLIQIAIVGGVGIVLASTSGLLTISVEATGMLAWGLLWYVLGFFMYATIFAAAGSLVSRQEEAQSVVTPVTMVLAIGYVVGFNLILQDPDSTASTVLSLIPLLSPIMMPGRIAAGTVAGWQILVAVILTAAAIALFTWIGSRIYRNAVLHTGGRVKLSRALTLR